MSVGGAVAIACVAFVPWLRYASPFWHAAIATQNIKPHFGPKEVQLILKELVGAGYFGSALVLVAAFGGLRTLANRSGLFWLLYIIVPIGGAIAANIAFGYFLAIRQMIFVLAPLSLLAAIGIERVAVARPRLAAIVASALLVACLYQNVYMCMRPREDWRAATQALTQASQSGACVIPVPESSVDLYRFFDARIADNHPLPGGSLTLRKKRQVRTG